MAGRQTGRPPFQATAARKRQVEELVSCGMTHKAIAIAIGCSEPTLRQHFADELEAGAAKKRAEVVGMLYKAARKGNVTAQKHLEAMTNAAPGSHPNAARAAPKEPALGKKAAADLAAKTPDTSTSMGELIARRTLTAKVH